MIYRMIAVLLSLISLFALSGCGTPTVKVTVAEWKEVPFVFEGTGMAEPLHVFPIVPHVGGQIMSSMPDVGDRVTAGDVLFRIDSSAYEAQREALRSQVTTPNIEPPAPVDDGAEAALLKEGIITRAEYDRLLERKGGNTPVFSSGGATAQAKEGVNRALAAVEASIASCVVKAPISGVISEVYVGEEKMALAGKPALLLRQNSPVIFSFDLPKGVDAFLEKAKREKRLSVSVSDEAHVWYGELKRTEVPADRLYTPYTMQVDNEGEDIVLGNSYSLRIESTDTLRCMVFPESALIDDHTVAVVTEDGLVDWRSVDILAKVDDTIRVIGGLKEGDKVITAPEAGLEIGMAVSVT